MTIKVLEREICPDSWRIGKRITIAGEVLELIEIEGNKYTWIDVGPTEQFCQAELATYIP